MKARALTCFGALCLSCGLTLVQRDSATADDDSLAHCSTLDGCQEHDTWLEQQLTECDPGECPNLEHRHSLCHPRFVRLKTTVEREQTRDAITIPDECGANGELPEAGKLGQSLLLKQRPDCSEFQDCGELDRNQELLQGVKENCERRNKYEQEAAAEKAEREAAEKARADYGREVQELTEKLEAVGLALSARLCELAAEIKSNRVDMDREMRISRGSGVTDMGLRHSLESNFDDMKADARQIKGELSKRKLQAAPCQKIGPLVECFLSDTCTDEQGKLKNVYRAISGGELRHP